MNFQVTDTKINLFTEIEKEKIKRTDDGAGRLIIKIDDVEDDYNKIIVLDLEKRLVEQVLQVGDKKIKEIIFGVEGKYRALKNKKDVPFINVKVEKIELFSKDETLKINKLKKKVRREFKEKNINELIEKYKGHCTEQTISDLKQQLEQKEINDQEIKLAKIELEKLKIESNLYKKRKYETNVKWYQNTEYEFNEVDTNSIDVLEDIYTTGTLRVDLGELCEKEKENYVAIRRIEGTERYQLVLGIRAFLRAKFNNSKVNAFITNLDRDEILETTEKVNNNTA